MSVRYHYSRWLVQVQMTIVRSIEISYILLNHIRSTKMKHESDSLENSYGLTIRTISNLERLAAWLNVLCIAIDLANSQSEMTLILI